MEADRQMQKQRDQIEKVRVFPMKNLERLMRQTVPDAKLAEDFKELVNECAAEFIGFIVSESVDRSMNDGRHHLTSEDIISSLAKLGFSDHHSALSLYLTKYRENIGTGHKEKGKESHVNAQAMTQSVEMARQLLPISPRHPGPTQISLQQVSQQLHQLQQSPVPSPQMGPPPQKYGGPMPPPYQHQQLPPHQPHQSLPPHQPHQPLPPHQPHQSLPPHQPHQPHQSLPPHQSHQHPPHQPHQPHQSLPPNQPHQQLPPHQAHQQLPPHQPHQQLPPHQPHQLPPHQHHHGQAPLIGQNSSKTLFQALKSGLPPDGQSKTLFHQPGQMLPPNSYPHGGPPVQREQVPSTHTAAGLQPSTNSIVQPKQISSAGSKLQPISQPLAPHVPLQNVIVQYKQGESTEPPGEVSQGNVDNLRKMVLQQQFQIQAIQDLISKFDDEEGSDESESDASAASPEKKKNGDA